jgi:hypothetical protein
MPNVSETVPTDSRICSRCCQRLPETAFRRRSTTSTLRMRQCRTCHATYERQRRQTNRVNAAGLSLQKSATAIARAPNLERLSRLVDLLTKQFGGPHQLYAFWLAEIERLKKTRRAGFRLLRFLEMLANIEYLRDVEIYERRKQINASE